MERKGGVGGKGGERRKGEEGVITYKTVFI